MTMNREFKLNFDQLKEEGASQKASLVKPSDADFYPSASNTRNICFTLKSGEKHFLNYTYLISCKFSPEAGKIELTFTTHHVELIGQRLDKVFEGLFFASVMNLQELDERYHDLENAESVFLNQILITALTV